MSQNVDTMTHTLKKLDVEIKDMNTRLRQLRKRRDEEKSRLFKYMTRHNIQNLGNITLKKLQPKDKVPRKKLIDKKRDAIDVLNRYGINDAEYVYNEILKRQKTIKRDDNS